MLMGAFAALLSWSEKEGLAGGLRAGPLLAPLVAPADPGIEQFPSLLRRDACSAGWDASTTAAHRMLLAGPSRCRLWQDGGPAGLASPGWPRAPHLPTSLCKGGSCTMGVFAAHLSLRCLGWADGVGGGGAGAVPCLVVVHSDDSDKRVETIIRNKDWEAFFYPPSTL